jgi:hypothetical protein
VKNLASGDDVGYRSLVETDTVALRTRSFADAQDDRMRQLPVSDVPAE